MHKQSYQQPVWWRRKKSGAHNALHGWQGLCLTDFHDIFPIQWKLVKGQQQQEPVCFSLACIRTLDLVSIRNRWPETSASGPTNPKHWITHSEGCMKELTSPTGAWPTPSFMEIDTEAFHIWALIFFSLWWRWDERRSVCKRSDLSLIYGRLLAKKFCFL